MHPGEGLQPIFLVGDTIQSVRKPTHGSQGDRSFILSGTLSSRLTSLRSNNPGDVTGMCLHPGEYTYFGLSFPDFSNFGRGGELIHPSIRTCIFPIRYIIVCGTACCEKLPCTDSGVPQSFRGFTRCSGMRDRPLTCPRCFYA